MSVLRRLTVDRATGELIENAAVEPLRISEESMQRKITGGPQDIVTTFVYKANPSVMDIDLKHPLPMPFDYFRHGMLLCLAARPYCLIDVEVPNRARADTLLTLRDEMAEIARAGWAEITTRAVSTVVPLPPVPCRGEARRLLKEAQRADSELQRIIAAKKQELDPSYSRRTAKSSASPKVYVDGRDLPLADSQGGLGSPPGEPAVEEGTEESDQHSQLPRGDRRVP